MKFVGMGTVHPSEDRNSNIHSSGIVTASGTEKIKAIQKFVEEWNNRSDMPNSTDSKPCYIAFDLDYDHVIADGTFATMTDAKTYAEQYMRDEEVEESLIYYCIPVQYATYKPEVNWH